MSVMPMQKAETSVMGRMRRERSLSFAAYAVLVCGLLLSFAVYQLAEHDIRSSSEKRLTARTHELNNVIHQRLLGFELSLRSAQAYVGHQDEVTSGAWQYFYQSLHLEESYRGFDGLAYLQRVRGDQLPLWQSRARELRGREFAILPEGERDEYVILTDVAPQTPEFAHFIGNDVWVEATRREAMERARDAGSPQITAPTELNFSGKRTPSFVMYQPVYSGGMLPTTVDERRRLLSGYVAAVFRYQTFIRSVLPEDLADVTLEIYDGARGPGETGQLVFSNRQDAREPQIRLTANYVLDVGGRSWTLVYQATDSFFRAGEAWFSRRLLATGVLLSLFAFAFVRSQARQRQRAERLAAEMTQSARSSEAHLSAIFEALPDSYVELDTEGRIVKLKLARNSGVVSSPSTRLGKHYSENLSRESATQFEEALVAARVAGSDYGRRVHYVNPDVDLWFEFSTTYRAAEGDTPAFYLVLSRNVTEQVALEDALRRHQERLEELVAERTAELSRLAESLQEAGEERQAIFDAATVGIFLVRNDVIVNCNRTLERMLGYDHGEVIGRNVREAYPDEAGYVEHFESLDLDLAQQKFDSEELEMVRRDGHRFWARLALRRVDVNNPAKGTAGTIEDITSERAALVEMERARQLAEAAGQAKADFLASMSHEIRTPMNSIIGMARLLQKSDLVPTQRDYLQKIRDASQHLLAVLNDILDFSKLEAGKMRVEKIDFDLEKMLGEVLSLVEERAVQKGLELIVDVGAAVPRQLIGDPLRISQVLINFANNAVKFTERGEIIVRVNVLEDRDDQVVLRFSVCDSGIGLSEEQSSRLFQSFEQADQSTSRQYGGSGLGLLIARQLAELMGGGVGVDSTPGIGSTFWMALPLGRGKSVEAGEIVPSPAAGLRGKRVLVVDDNPCALQTVSTMLEALAFSVTAVDSGGDALSELMRATRDNRPYNVAIIDWQMPIMDGIDTVAEIRRLAQRQPLLVLLITTRPTDESRQAALSVGADDILAKPVTPSRLFDSLTRLLGAEKSAPRPASETVAEAALPGEATLLPALAGLSALLVEDNEINQEVATALLQEAGLTVDVAENGAVAVAKVQQKVYDVVLMDMQMPVMDGLTATREIRKRYPADELPIIAMTANAMASDRERCLAAGMNEHVAKPIDYDDLLAKMQRCVGPRAVVDGASQTMASQAPVSEDEAGWLDALDGVAGLDVASGLRRSMGRSPLYQRVLGKFIEFGTEVAERLVRATEHADWPTVERDAHTLKGVSAQIGADALSVLANDLVAAIRSEAATEQILSRQKALLDRLIPLVEAIAECLPVAAEETLDTVVDHSQLMTICQLLAIKLGENDFASNRLFDANEALLRSAFGAALEPLAKAVRDCDYGPALEWLRRIAGEQGIRL